MSKQYRYTADHLVRLANDYKSCRVHSHVTSNGIKAIVTYKRNGWKAEFVHDGIRYSISGYGSRMETLEQAQAELDRLNS